MSIATHELVSGIGQIVFTSDPAYYQSGGTRRYSQIMLSNELHQGFRIDNEH